MMSDHSGRIRSALTLATVVAPTGLAPAVGEPHSLRDMGGEPTRSAAGQNMRHHPRCAEKRLEDKVAVGCQRHLL